MTDKAKTIIHDSSELIKQEDWNSFFNVSVNNFLRNDYIGEIYQFIMFEAGVDLLHKMNYIPPYAFKDCNLIKTLSVPNNIKRIGMGAFSECGLSQISLSKAMLSSIPNFCFKDCTTLSTVTLPETATAIKMGAFEGCSVLERINLDKVEIIYGSAFKNCKLLTDIDVSSLNKVSSSAFTNCPAENIIIANTQ